jgi:hypothetical protein
MRKRLILKESPFQEIIKSGIHLKKRRRHRSHRNRIFYRKSFIESKYRSRILSNNRKSSLSEDESENESLNDSSVKSKSIKDQQQIDVRFETPDQGPLLRSHATNIFKWILNHVKTNPDDITES